MKLKKYSSERFAGTSDVGIEFTDGLNVVLGNNESGKSTMIEGIFRALTTTAYLDRRSDKDFLNSFFPTDGGNVIDSELAFEDSGNEYILSKTWVNSGGEQRVSLKKTDGKKMTGKEAEAWLNEILKYGKGIYSNVIFGRQSNEAEILEWLYAFLAGNSQDGRDEAKGIISQALSAAGGVSLDKLSELLDAEIESRESNWDFSKDAPVKKGAKRNLGSIYVEYDKYLQKREEAEKAQNNIAELERCRKDLSESREKYVQLSREKEEYASKKAEVDMRERNVEIAAKEAAMFNDCQRDLSGWNETEKNLSIAKPLLALQTEIENRRKHEELQKFIADIKKLSDEIEADENDIQSLEDISDDFKKAEKLEKNIDKNKLTLSAGELTAQIKMVKPHTAEVTHAGGSEAVSDIAEIKAKGFVSVNIPDIAEIVVAPKNVNVAEIRAAIEADEKIFAEILTKYSAGSIDELEELQNKYNDKLRLIESNKAKLENKLAGREISAFENELTEIKISGEKIPENFEEQKNSVLTAMKTETLDDCVKKCEMQIEYFTEQHESIEKLQAELEKYSGAKERLEKLNNDDTPHKADFDRRIAELNSDISNMQKETDDLQRQLGSLESADDVDLSELEEAVRSAEKAFEREKKECLIYKKVREDLNRLKENSEDNFSGFYDKFNGYLSEISGGRLKFSDTALQSGTNIISGSELLSEGTKKTLTLAFRLAVLDFFYPDGDGFIVLDDALIDMDPERRERSAAMLKKFAESNQVIITTCDPAVAELLSADVIQI